VTQGSPRGLSAGAAVAMVRAVWGRPDLWWSALGALRRLAVPGWWRRRPYLPVPDARLWDFRMLTAYGRADADPRADDVRSYLAWCRSTGRGHRTGGRAAHRPTDRLGRIRSG
jgi:hypothetical protein